MPEGSCDQTWRMGAAKAMVLPEPVREPPRQSLPVGSVSGVEAHEEEEGRTGDDFGDAVGLDGGRVLEAHGAEGLDKPWRKTEGGESGFRERHGGGEW